MPDQPTISPQEARDRRARERRAGSDSRLMRAIDAEFDRKQQDAQEVDQRGVDPKTLFWAGVIRNYVLGLPLVGFGFIGLYQAFVQLLKPGYDVGWADMLRFGIPGVALFLGTSYIAPTQTFTFLRFFGLGGIAERLPFLRPKLPPAAPQNPPDQVDG